MKVFMLLILLLVVVVFGEIIFRTIYFSYSHMRKCAKYSPINILVVFELNKQQAL